MPAMAPVGEPSWSRCNRAARRPGPRRQKAPLHRRARALAGFPRHRSRAKPCKSGSPDSDPFVIRRSQTTKTPPHRRARACPSPSLAQSNNRGGQAPALRKKTSLRSVGPETLLLDDGQRGGNPLGCASGIRGPPRYGNIETGRSLLRGCIETGRSLLPAIARGPVTATLSDL